MFAWRSTTVTLQKCSYAARMDLEYPQEMTSLDCILCYMWNTPKSNRDPLHILSPTVHSLSLCPPRPHRRWDLRSVSLQIKYSAPLLPALPRTDSAGCIDVRYTGVLWQQCVQEGEWGTAANQAGESWHGSFLWSDSQQEGGEGLTPTLKCYASVIRIWTRVETADRPVTNIIMWLKLSLKHVNKWGESLCKLTVKTVKLLLSHFLFTNHWPITAWYNLKHQTQKLSSKITCWGDSNENLQTAASAWIQTGHLWGHIHKVSYLTTTSPPKWCKYTLQLRPCSDQH